MSSESLTHTRSCEKLVADRQPTKATNNHSLGRNLDQFGGSICGFVAITRLVGYSLRLRAVGL